MEELETILICSEEYIFIQSGTQVQYWKSLLSSLNGVPNKHRLLCNAHEVQKGALKLLHFAHRYSQTL